MRFRRHLAALLAVAAVGGLIVTVNDVGAQQAARRWEAGSIIIATPVDITTPSSGTSYGDPYSGHWTTATPIPDEPPPGWQPGTYSKDPVWHKNIWRCTAGTIEFINLQPVDTGECYNPDKDRGPARPSVNALTDSGCDNFTPTSGCGHDKRPGSGSASG